MLDEGALTECSGTGERCVHLETALAAPYSCSGRALLPCFLEALGQMYLKCKQCCHVLRGALRAVEETVDDNVLTLAGLSSDLKEKHFTTKSGRRRKLCDEDGEPARTHRWRRHKALEGNFVQGGVGRPVCWLPHLPRSACVFSCTEDGTRMEESAKGKIAYLATHVGTNIAKSLPIQVCGSQSTGSQAVVQTLSPHVIFFHV